jgi:hypothetical protein
MRHHVRTQAVGVLGESVTREVIEEIVANIRQRNGGQLGGDEAK